MSDHRHASAAHLYAPYPLATAFYPDHRPLQGPLPRLAVQFASTPVPIQRRSPLPCSYSYCPPSPLHSLQPFLPLARIDQVPPHVLPATLSSTTAVIVSPHYNPPPEREEPRSLKQKPFVNTALARQQLDGRKEQAYSVHTSAPKMTPKELLNSDSTPSKRDDASITPQRLQRPFIVSQHSNSVPSTPLQLARKYESRSRSPSPNGGLGSHSPRSVSSEANSTMPTLRLGRPFKCKYETNVGQLGRRRMPYEKSELLDPAEKEPKKVLDPHEDDKLSGDMRELYDRLQPSVENTRKRDHFVQKVKRILDAEFPGNLFTVHVFGSSGNMLYTTDSDGKTATRGRVCRLCTILMLWTVDICIQTPMTSLEEMHPLAEALDKRTVPTTVHMQYADNWARWHATGRLHTSGQSPDSQSMGP